MIYSCYWWSNIYCSWWFKYSRSDY